MKWLRLLVVGLILLGLFPITTQAATSAGVSVTATPDIGMLAPSGFTIVYINDNQLDLSWVPPVNYPNVMVRAAYGHIPTSITDGYQVYYGPANNVSDTAASMATPDIIYYRAWAQKLDGTWGGYADADTEGLMSTSFLFITLALLAIAMTTAMFVSKQSMLGFPSAIFWALFGTYSYTLSTTPWGDIYYYVFFASTFGMTLFAAFGAYGLREKHDTYAEREMDEPEHKPLLLRRPPPAVEDDTEADEFDSLSEPSPRTQRLRDRAEERKTIPGRSRRRSWGEFK